MTDSLSIVVDEMSAGMKLAKCRQCGCMRESIAAMTADLQTAPAERAGGLVRQAVQWARQMKPVKYDCLGCEHCYPAAAQNALMAAFPEVEFTHMSACDFTVTAGVWPPVPGEYFVVDAAAPVAVSTLSSPALAAGLAGLAGARPEGLAIAGKTETENIGVDKLIKNVIANPALRYLVVCGAESAGHHTGQALVALGENGVDAQGRVIGAMGKRPVLRNVTAQEVEAFRRQVRVIDMIGCEDLPAITSRVRALSRDVPVQPAVRVIGESLPQLRPTVAPAAREAIVLLPADEPVALDTAGYFVILPLRDRGTINVEHYGYDNTLLHVVEGASARSLYKTIVAQGWVTELSHAAYLGTELAKAELSLRHGLPYVQDAA